MRPGADRSTLDGDVLPPGSTHAQRASRLLLLPVRGAPPSVGVVMLGVGGVATVRPRAAAGALAVSGPLAPPPGQRAAGAGRVPDVPAGPGLPRLAGLGRRLAAVGGGVEPQERGLLSVGRGRGQRVELLHGEPQPTNRNKREKQRGGKKKGGGKGIRVFPREAG